MAMMTAPNPSAVVRFLRSAGGASVGLARHRTENRMVPLLRFETREGKQFQVELTPDDVRGIGHDIVMLLSADQAEVTAWWQALADGSDAASHGQPVRRQGSAMNLVTKTTTAKAGSWSCSSRLGHPKPRSRCRRSGFAALHPEMADSSRANGHRARPGRGRGARR